MEVEIYRDQSLNKIITDVDNLEEWEALCKETGMDNQYSLASKGKSPSPYPHMNESYMNLIKSLCPTTCNVTEYSKTTVPLEVLREIKLCQTEQYFQKLEVWYDDKGSDPFIIGHAGYYYAYKSGKTVKNADGKDLHLPSEAQMKDYLEVNNIVDHSIYFTTSNRYIIARFGDHKRTWDQLKVMASKKLMEKYGAELKKTVKTAQSALDNLKENVTLYLSAEINERELEGKTRW